MSKKILLVDDSSLEFRHLQNDLKGLDFEIIHARNGIEGLEKLAENPDLIILDIVMPDCGGETFLTILKNIPLEKFSAYDTAGKRVLDEHQKVPPELIENVRKRNYSSIPVIIFTSYQTTQLIEDVLCPTDFVKKPYEKKEMVDLIIQYINP